MKGEKSLKKSLWCLLTLGMSGLMVWGFLRGVQMWYIPLHLVDSPNAGEDYMLWNLCLLCTAFLLPFWFLAIRKTVRLFRGDHWLPVSRYIPKPVTVLAAAAFLGLTIWQAREAASSSRYIPHSEVPEYTRAAATGHTVHAAIYGIALFWVLYLFVKQVMAQGKRPKEAD